MEGQKENFDVGYDLVWGWSSQPETGWETTIDPGTALMVHSWLLVGHRRMVERVVGRCSRVGLD